MEADDEFDRWLTVVDDDDLEVVFEATREVSAETREKYGRALQSLWSRGWVSRGCGT